MKSIPSSSLLSDQLKQAFIGKILQEINLTLPEYSEMVSNRSIVLRKQILTNRGLLVLNQREHESLIQNLRRKYPSLFSKGNKTQFLFAKHQQLDISSS